MRSVQRYRSVIAFVLAVCLLLVQPQAMLRAQDKPDQPYESKARQAILIDARTGRVLYEKDADAAVPPASMSKLMTMIMVFEALKAGKLTLDQTFKVSQDAWKRGGASSGGSTMYAELKSEIRLEDLIKGVIV